jgi:hypothetical protein
MKKTNEPIEEELVPEDDAIIGRAFRWSAAVIAAIALLVVASLWIFRGEAPGETIRSKDVGRIPSLVSDPAKIPSVTFTDITAASGIRFERTNGAKGKKLLPETMGGGAAFFDYDGDGDQDLLFVNGCWWPGEAPPGSAPTQTLYENDGTGHFTDVTAKAGLDVTFYGMGVAVGDYDGDGREDLFFTAVGSNHLFHNDGGHFTEVTAKAGVGGNDRQWSSGAGFFDYDGDGDLDLMVLNYVKWSPEIDFSLNFTLNGHDRAYGPPANYEGAHPYLYRNDGDGRFTDVSKEAGIQIANRATGVPVAKSLALAFLDYDRDGRLDVFVANDTVRNFVFHNRGDGTFEEVGEKTGFAYDSMGSATGAMGIDVSWYRNDDDVAIGLGNFANEMTSLYVTQQNLGLFSDEATIEGIGSPSRRALSFGVIFLDYDLDGRQDFLEANGHLENEIHEIQESQTYRQPAQLFWNAGPTARRCFSLVPESAATRDLYRPIVGRGVAVADIDGDGDLDVLLTQTAGAPVLLRNDQALGHHWARLLLTGKGANRDAIGAEVTLTAGGVVQRRIVSRCRGYLCQSELAPTFGLGAATKIDALTVRWPDGKTEKVEPPAIDRATRIRESE